MTRARGSSDIWVCCALVWEGAVATGCITGGGMAGDEASDHAVIVTGPGPVAARCGYEAAQCDRGYPRLIVSFGLAGALVSGLVAGSLVIPRRVIDTGGGAFSCDEAWRQDLVRRISGSGLSEGYDTILGSDRLLPMSSEKIAVGEATGAAAVDMESHIWAALAARDGTPFIVVRAICDTVDITMPPAALAAVGDAGGLVLGRLMWALLRRPGQVVGLARLGVARVVARRGLVVAGRALAELGRV